MVMVRCFKRVVCRRHAPHSASTKGNAFIGEAEEEGEDVRLKYVKSKSEVEPIFQNALSKLDAAPWANCVHDAFLFAKRFNENKWTRLIALSKYATS